MNNWISLDKEFPKDSREVKIKFEDGSEAYAYLCPCCKSEFRCPVTGSSFANKPILWRLLNEFEI